MTGEYLTNAKLGELEKNGLDIQNCRGQGYDNGANMRAKLGGKHLLNDGDRRRSLRLSSFSKKLLAEKKSPCSKLVMRIVYGRACNATMKYGLANEEIARKQYEEYSTGTTRGAFGDRPRNFEPWSSDGRHLSTAPPLLTTTPHHREDVSALDRFNVHRCPTRQVFVWYWARTCDKASHVEAETSLPLVARVGD
ncbi:hypothetical protein TNCV_1352921 [Trichonephila clavipes]|nr:hypothetical protein TNCV_1352921 [Trichonephila clavipes]